MQQRGLALLIIRPHFARVAARRLGAFAVGVFHLDEGRAEAFHLFLDRRAHIERADDRAEAVRRRDGLQPRHAGAEHDDLGRHDGARRRHHHRQDLAEAVRRVDHRLVAGNIALGRERIHALGAADARDQFHGETGQAMLGIGLRLFAMTQRIKHPDQNRVGFHHRQLVHRPPTLKTMSAWP